MAMKWIARASCSHWSEWNVSFAMSYATGSTDIWMSVHRNRQYSMITVVEYSGCFYQEGLAGALSRYEWSPSAIES